jgi:hypothetical protein
VSLAQPETQFMETAEPRSRSGAIRPGLQSAQFRCVAAAGMGDPGNSYPHAMAWFKDRLYVTTGRHALAAIFSSSRAKKNWYWEQCPVRLPEKSLYDEFDLRAQVWRHNPADGAWDKVLESPIMPNHKDGRVPYYAGARNMTVFQSRRDSSPALYITTYAPPQGPGALLVRSYNGIDWEQFHFEGFEAGQYRNFRPLVPFKGRLFTAPTGKGESANVCGSAVVLESADPEREPWFQVNVDDFGDPHNEAIFEMAAFGGYLYAGTVNAFGAQLWKTDGEGPPPYRWTRVLDKGAGRGPNNEAFVAFDHLNGALYVGAVILDGGYDRRHGIGPAPAELVRVWPDDSWDVVVGEGRMTDSGLKFPISGLSSGFNNPYNGYVWRLCAHDGHIYVGTFKSTATMPYMSKETVAPDVAAFMDEDRLNLILDNIGGCDLWRSRDGVIWRPMTRTGFTTYFNFGIRSMASSPYGLFVGCSNPYGPDVAVRRKTGWHYQKNPRGGCEIWLGSHRHAVSSRRSASQGFVGSWHDEPPIPMAGEVRVADSEDAAGQLIETWYGRTGYRTVGCWPHQERDASRASANLVTEALSFRVATGPPRRVLELGSDHGATASHLRARFPDAFVDTLPLALEPAPATIPADVRLIHRRPKSPPPAEELYDLVLGLEGLSRSTAGPAWLAALRRWIHPGGEFVGSFFVCRDPIHASAERGVVIGGEELTSRLLAAGFEEVEILDATASCWTPFRVQLQRFLAAHTVRDGLEEQDARRAQQLLYGAFEPVDAYLLVRAGPARRPAADAEKPEETKG